ncbi:MAG: glutamine-hydrolyzing carbamoyl-phosphate synthase small subunit [Gammaproteobacteria bacterium]|nr:glutamine-hydrolyzing carbamoyl-phosphate synthase small subunit [Gammaproteobacteria bacterium]
MAKSVGKNRGKNRPAPVNFPVNSPPALLVLEDGSVFRGTSAGADGLAAGEVVFNTALCGYQEILTDPSYARQLVTLTCAHIGNVGANAQDFESRRVFCAGLIVKNIPQLHCNWRAETSLPEYLREHDVVAICDVDTRRLTRLLRIKGAQRGAVVAGANADSEKSLQLALEAARAFPGLAGMDLAREVSAEKPYQWSGGGEWRDGEYAAAPPEKFRVVACDYGVKHNILRQLAMRGCAIEVLPARATAEEILRRKPDGVFLSNGPGDPAPCGYAVDAIRELLARKVPLFGICLGHQLLALAGGAQTEKMKFGHHGANHPVRDLDSGRVLITSQNHGFAVRAESLPEHTRVTHISLFDGSVQGLERLDAPAFSFQGHPEASPGPHDAADLFDKFAGMMAANMTAGARHA